jgi:hypothetical protein
VKNADQIQATFPPNRGRLLTDDSAEKPPYFEKAQKSLKYSQLEESPGSPVSDLFGATGLFW